jgi:hypothetical protein
MMVEISNLDGVLQSTEVFDNSVFPRLARQQSLWDPNVSLTFATQLLAFIKKNVTEDDANIVYTIKYDARTKEVRIMTPVKGGPDVFVL